ncbi:MAG TPA: hypothetical protein PKL28_03185 [Rhodocyclaceae bacterium]|nr:hypothetical protein [Rhodocyclaceae bacterium]HNE43527.1 hypothetical protein [Rhodocyclaceae bacterium]HNM20849.1 hypothetical protein [Rhodocyclaceae bacterium]HNM80031.1 hypothetical protein [Rhodocyclaceae bacterium]HNP03355.1 hypothetical protein [Rhodocyclaceae bacterium]
MLAFGHIPSCDYYFGASEGGSGGPQPEHQDLSRVRIEDIKFDSTCEIVIVRYLPRKHLHRLAEIRKSVASIKYFLDDDLPAAIRARELPFRYALKTSWRYARSRPILAQICDGIWVSTPVLAARYAYANPVVRPPSGLGEIGSASTSGSAYFYHGTWAHRWEIEWLVPVVAEVQRKLSGVWFEIIGTDRVKELFHGIPRVRVVHPMPWADYLDYTRRTRFEVGLVPCLDTRFNQARSHVKYLDCSRMGAVGIFSDVPAYSGVVKNGINGVLLTNSRSQWVEAIIELLGSPDRRRELLEGMRREADERKRSD